MTELEEALAKMEAENKKLQDENRKLKSHSGVLVRENESLRDRLGVKEEPMCEDGSVEKLGSPGSAVSYPPQQQETTLALYKAASHSLSFLLMLM